jgi:hypothetical protein
MGQPTLTRHTVRCPLDGSTATITVRTHSGRPLFRRRRDIATCSRLPSTAVVAPARSGYFPDLAPPMSYVCDVDSAPRHSPEVTCSRRCLTLLGADETRIAEPIPCTSGVCDALELARRTQTPAVMRVLWSYAD